MAVTEDQARFATEAQDTGGAAVPAAAPDEELARVATWEERKARARMRAAASRANVNALDYLEEHGTDTDDGAKARIWVTGVAVVEMQGSKFEFSRKAVVFTALNESGAAGPTLDFYGLAGVNAVTGMAEELGAGPWPEALPCEIGTVDTEHGPRALLTPLW